MRRSGRRSACVYGATLSAALLPPRTAAIHILYHVGRRLAAWPVILLAVAARTAVPILQGQRQGVVDAESPLLRRVDEEEPAERPERLPAEGGFRLLVEQDHT